MKLYFAPRTRAIRPRWLLEELEVPHELVRVDLAQEENRAAAYLAVNPLGELPALVDGGVTLTECLAICLHLADRFPERGLAPPPGSPERARYYQAMVFAERTLDAAVMDVYYHLQLPEPQRVGIELERGATKRARLNDVLAVLATTLGDREVLDGDRFSAADLVTSSLLHLANQLKLLEHQPKLVEYVSRHSGRPAVRRAVS